jgi:hypothetical protein
MALTFFVSDFSLRPPALPRRDRPFVKTPSRFSPLQPNPLARFSTAAPKAAASANESSE